jgi:hypothetical protein
MLLKNSWKKSLIKIVIAKMEENVNMENVYVLMDGQEKIV